MEISGDWEKWLETSRKVVKKERKHYQRPAETTYNLIYILHQIRIALMVCKASPMTACIGERHEGVEKLEGWWCLSDIGRAQLAGVLTSKQLTRPLSYWLLR